MQEAATFFLGYTEIGQVGQSHACIYVKDSMQQFLCEEVNKADIMIHVPAAIFFSCM